MPDNIASLLKQQMGYTEEVHPCCLSCIHHSQEEDQVHMALHSCVLNPPVPLLLPRPSLSRCNHYSRLATPVITQGA